MSNRRQQTNQVKVFETIIEYAKPTTLVLEDLMTIYKTKSSLIRHLSGLGKSRTEISKFMGIRYQHVRNVLTQPLKQA